MKSYPKVPRVGSTKGQEILTDKVTVVEKLDGANFRFTHGNNVDGVGDDRLVFGSKNVIYKNEEDIDKNFLHAVEYVRERVSPERFLEDVQRDGDSLTVFAEAMHAHTLDYGEPEPTEHGAPAWQDVPNAIVFDVYSENDGWLGWTDVRRVASRCGLTTPPIIEDGIKLGDMSALEPIESAYRDGVAEGVVLRGRGGTFPRAKYRTEEFLDQHRSATRSSGDDVPESQTHELANELLRKEAWVEKWIHKYHNRGRDIQMGIMEDLWRDVFDDIIEEEYETVFLGNHTFNTKKFRSIIASHTAEKLQEYMARPDDSVLNEA